MSSIALRPVAALGLARRAIAPLVAAVVIIGLWQGAVEVLGISSFILPAPDGVFNALTDQWTVIRQGALVTLKEVVLGMAMGTGLGILVALLITRFRSISTPILVAAVVVNCAPIVAMAPIANNWLGVTSIFSKAAVAAVMVFFPVLVGMSRGLLEVPKADLDVMESVAATPRQVLVHVRVPHSLPYLFSALRLGSTLAIIGVIVTEYLGGRADTLGVFIAQQASLPRYAEAWAGIVIASALGLALFAIVVVVERIVMPWRKDTENAT